MHNQNLTAILLLISTKHPKMKQIFNYFCVSIAIILLCSCTSLNLTQQQPEPTQEHNAIVNVDDPSPQKIEIILDKNLEIAMGETIYVPIYSHIYYGNQQQIYYLSANLSIRNTDQTNSIIITAVDYYDTDGKLLKQYVQIPQKLGPLGSRGFYLEAKDKTGGSGANFLVEWVSEKRVTQPIVEAVMIGTSGTQGIGFSSAGKVIKNRSK